MNDLSGLIPALIHHFTAAPAAPAGYIDPSTGGLLAQILTVALAAFSGVLFFFSRQIKTGLAKLRRKLRRDADDLENR